MIINAVVSKPCTTHSSTRIPRALWWGIECGAKRIRESKSIFGCMAWLVGRQTEGYCTLPKFLQNQRWDQTLCYGTEDAVSWRGSITQTILLSEMIMRIKKKIHNKTLYITKLLASDWYFLAISDPRYRCASKPTFYEREIAIWIIRTLSEV